MDRGGAQEDSVASLELLNARLNDAFGFAPVEVVVLSPAIQADHGPHAVIVRVDGHARRPDDVEDCQLGGAVQGYDFRSLRHTQRTLHICPVGNGTPDYLLDGVIGGLFCERVAAVSDELLGTEHAIPRCWVWQSLSA